jgi:hypothetical protein
MKCVQCRFSAVVEIIQKWRHKALHMACIVLQVVIIVIGSATWKPASLTATNNASSKHDLHQYHRQQLNQSCNIHCLHELHRPSMQHQHQDQSTEHRS